MISLDEARSLLLRETRAASVEDVDIGDALGRVAGFDIRAPWNLPRESRSRLDGYALRSIDTSDAAEDHPVRCRLTRGFIAAGQDPAGELEAGCCCKVMTGAVVPSGTDAVLAQEYAGIENGHLVLRRAVKSTSGLMTEGAEAARGELLVGGGEVLTPTRLGLVAAFGHDRVSVTVQPRVALLSTGDEIRELGDLREGPVSFSNNRHLLAWLTRIHGGIPIHLGISRDDPAEMVDRLGHIDADLFITTGGTGRGEKDFIPEAWRRIGVEPVFQGVNISPGKGTSAGVKQGTVYLALPGSPWGGRVIFEELIKPFLWRFQEASCRWPLTLKAMLNGKVTHREGSCRVLAGVLDMSRCPASFTPAGKQSGSAFQQVRNRFGYMILQPHMLEISTGSEVDVRLFDLPLLAVALLGDG